MQAFGSHQLKVMEVPDGLQYFAGFVPGLYICDMVAKSITG